MVATKLTYNYVLQAFNEKGAQLQTTKNEFESLNKPSLHDFDIIASCGHTRKIRVSRTLPNNILCVQCSKTKAIVKQKETHNSSEHNLGYVLEYDSYIFIKELTSHAFNIIKLTEGTKADLLFKPKDISEDLWCQIQLKATKAPARKNQYNFNLNNQYSSMVVIFNCLQDKKLWVISGSHLLKLRNITICDKNNTTYAKHNCKSEDLADRLLQFYQDESIRKINSKSAYTAVSSNVAKEQNYRLLRETNLSFIPFEYSEMSGLVYDFQINGLKIQEKYKNCTNDNPHRYNFHLSKYGGMFEGKQVQHPYEQSDNAFYWFHIPEGKLFYVIPEKDLLEHGFIKSENHKGKKSIVLHPYCSFEDLTERSIITAFANKYIFDYDNLDAEKLSNMFATIDSL